MLILIRRKIMFEYCTTDLPFKVFNRISWGANINPTRYAEFFPKYPDWLNPHQKLKWRDRGLVVWDATTKVVTHLYANYALKTLEAMKEINTWKSNGFTIGAPAYRMSLPDTTDKHSVPIECHQDGWVLINKISLSSEQVEELLKFLVSEEHALILIAANEDRDVREACAMVVEILLSMKEEKRTAGKQVGGK
jgi:hypothetical protein